MDSNQYRRYVIAAVALIAIAAIAVIGFCALALITLHRRADPARKAVSWIKASFVLLTLAILCALATYAIALAFFETDFSGGATPRNLDRAGAHVELLWELFDQWAQAAILVGLVRLATGIHNASRNGSALWHRLARWATAAMAFVVFALSAAYYGYSVNLVVREQGLGGTGMGDFRTQNQLATASNIIIWITSLGVGLVSIFAWMLSSGFRSLSSLLVFANFLNFIGTTWNMVFYIRYRLQGRFPPLYVGILHAILAMWTSVALLVIAWWILVRKAGGVWTTGRYGNKGIEMRHY
ncbi:hypothetical protein ACRALDRAFT_1072848 [Sodiomyces alcalophilus JCM 7366]|uniref:uncharacterized protein n=1 Tax=Sodiomyces alcalophilus JCM 7366 TaxID=591952 RepID=UPI0039B68501